MNDQHDQKPPGQDVLATLNLDEIALKRPEPSAFGNSSSGLRSNPSYANPSPSSDAAFSGIIFEDQGDDHSHQPSSSSWQRLLAYILDSIFLGIAFLLLQTLIGNFVSSQIFDNEVAVHTFRIALVIFYFSIPHFMLGQSIGKKILGLRVVRSESNEHISAVQIIFRDLLTRGLPPGFLSSVWTVACYLSVLIHKDRRSLPDLIFQTRVINISGPSQELTQQQILARIFIPVGAVAAIFFTIIFSFFYTSWPIRTVANNMALNGWEIEGVGGSLASGIEFARVAYKQDDQDIEITNGKFKYSGLVDLFIERKLIITTIEADSVLVRAGATSSKKTKSQEEVSTPQAPTSTGSSSEKTTAKNEFPLREFLIQKIEIRNLTVEHVKLHKSFKIESVLAQHLEFKNGIASLQNFSISSQILDVAMEEIEFNPKEKLFRMAKPSVGTLKRAFDPQLLLQDIAFRFETEVKGYEPTKFALSAFSDKVTVRRMTDGSYLLMFNNFTPREFIRSGFPLNNLNINAEYPNLMSMALSLPVTGKLLVRNSEFVFSSIAIENRADSPNKIAPAGLMPGGTASNEQMSQALMGLLSAKPERIAVHTRGNKKYQLISRANSLMDLFSGSQKPWMELRTDTHQGAGEILAELYFGRPLRQLSPEQAKLIANDEKYFATPLIYARPQPMPTLGEPIRYPAHAQNPMLNAKKSLNQSGLPQKLPAYKKHPK